eukprot:1178989-Prorocentrum_minimum.AAC.1
MKPLCMKTLCNTLKPLCNTRTSPTHPLLAPLLVPLVVSPPAPPPVDPVYAADDLRSRQNPSRGEHPPPDGRAIRFRSTAATPARTSLARSPLGVSLSRRRTIWRTRTATATATRAATARRTIRRRRARCPSDPTSQRRGRR